MREIPLYLFAKAPVAGHAKQRLCPPLNGVQAASVALALLEHASSVVEAGWPGQCILSATPDLSHPAFLMHQKSKRWKTQIQPQLDLGGRMQTALQEGIMHAESAVVLGTDIPSIDANILQRAYLALSEGRQVVGPSEDGGFYLLGLRQMPDTLFDGIRWGSGEVYAKLMENAAVLNMVLDSLPLLSDCDDYADLERATIKGRPGLSFIQRRA